MQRSGSLRLVLRGRWRSRSAGARRSDDHSNPAVGSDLIPILPLRYGARAGSEQRPLAHSIATYWMLDSEAYPFEKRR